MAIEMPESGSTFIPEVPVNIKNISVDLYDFLQSFKKEVQRINEGMFLNISLIATALNSGTSGVFVITGTSAATFTVSSGVMIAITTV